MLDKIILLWYDLIINGGKKYLKMIKDEQEMIKNDQKTVKIIDWYGMKIVEINSVEEPEKFMLWLYGQTLPLVEGAENPCGWAYIWDYERFKKGLGCVD